MDRLQFHTKLKELCPTVYYQPPPDVRLTYPCIVYSDGSPMTRRGDNKLYLQQRGYDVVYITRTPMGESYNSDDWFKFYNKFEYCNFGTHYISDNLHHYTYKIYF